MGGTPARIGGPPLDDGRPERARNIIAAGCDGDRQTAIFLEPMRGFRHQRPEGRSRSEADGNVHEIELPKSARVTRRNVAAQQRHGAKRNRQDDAETVGNLAHQHIADAEAEHRAGEGERCIGAGRAKVCLHNRDHNDDRPHADAAERTDNKGKAKPDPRDARVQSEGCMRR